ncbi:SKP1-like protein 20 [Fagus crenata]|jgi:S-phase kinase-associated protein 1
MSNKNENPSSSSIKITLKTSDGEEFLVEEAVAMEFVTVKSFFEEEGDSQSTPMPLPNVSSFALSRVIVYCRRILDIRAKLPTGEAGEEELKEAEKKVKEERKAFEAEFVKDESNEAIRELILAANYLDIKEMLQFLNQNVADRIQNKSVEYVRNFFGIENDFSPEEEAKLREEFAWAFEDVDED